jgi:2-polyprenyl-6-methoxyphenol hydroxylase-like FAD-dependent oxidoreductase
VRYVPATRDVTDVAIIGAGIGGLAAALSLHRHGRMVAVFEQADAVRELGVGINVLPPAVSVPAELGLLGDLDKAAVRTGELIMATRRGDVVWREPRGLGAGHAVPQFSIHRGRLQGILATALRRRAGRDVIRVGHRLKSFRRDDKRVEATFVDRAGRARAVVTAAALVGADGIHSTVRNSFHPAEGAPRWNGLMLWRGATPWHPFLDGRTMVIGGGLAGKFVVYPIEPGAGDERRLTNWGVVAPIAEPGSAPPRREDWSRPARRAELAPHVARFRSPLVDLAGLVAATGDIFEYPMCDRDPLDRWSHGRVTLLGDAAHPMYPMGSNGATQAIIDGRSLAEHLAAGPPLQALRAYEAERPPATARIVELAFVG